MRTEDIRGALLSRPTMGPPKNGKLQVDVGNFKLYLADDVVGEVWVDVDPEHPHDQGCSIEYWCLFGNYVEPSARATDVELRFVYVTGLHASLSDFQAFARNQAGARYITAKCQQQMP